MKQLFYKNTKLDSRNVSVLSGDYKHHDVRFIEGHVPYEHFSAHYKRVKNWGNDYTELQYQEPEGLFICPADVRFEDCDGEYEYGRITRVTCRFNSFLKYKGVWSLCVKDTNWKFPYNVSPANIEFLPKEGFDVRPIEVGDPVEVYRNQASRDGEVLTVNEQEALIEYDMPKSGRVFRNIVSRHNVDIYRVGKIPKSLEL